MVILGGGEGRGSWDTYLGSRETKHVNVYTSASLRLSQLWTHDTSSFWTLAALNVRHTLVNLTQALHQATKQYEVRLQAPDLDLLRKKRLLRALTSSKKKLASYCCSPSPSTATH